MFSWRRCGRSARPSGSARRIDSGAAPDRLVMIAAPGDTEMAGQHAAGRAPPGTTSHRCGCVRCPTRRAGTTDGARRTPRRRPRCRAASTPHTSAAASSVQRSAAAEQLLDAAGVLVEERVVEQPVGAEVAGDRQRQHDVGARQRRDVAIGARRHRRAPGIDHGEAGAGGAGLLHERREVGVRHGRVGAPHHHVARRGRRRAGRPTACDRRPRPTPRRRWPRRSSPAPRRRPSRRNSRSVRAGAGQHAGRRVVEERDRPSPARRRRARPGASPRPGRGPRPSSRRSNSPDPFGAGPHQRREDAIGPVHPLGVALHLLADEALGEGVAGRGVDLGDPSRLHRHLERAGVGTVEGAGGDRHAEIVRRCRRSGWRFGMATRDGDGRRYAPQAGATGQLTGQTDGPDRRGRSTRRIDAPDRRAGSTGRGARSPTATTWSSWAWAPVDSPPDG